MYWSQSVTPGKFQATRLEPNEDHPGLLVSDRSSIYWVDHRDHMTSDVRKDSLTGGRFVDVTAALPSPHNEDVRSLSVDDTGLYWINYTNGSAHGELVKLPRSAYPGGL